MQKYNYIIEEDIVKIHIKNRKNELFEILIDLEDLSKIENYSYRFIVAKHKNVKGYYIKASKYLGTFNGKAKYKSIMLHRFLTNANDNQVVDHINHNTLDNRKSNLRVIETDKNSKNRKTRNSNNSTGYRNVSKIDNKFVVQLQIDGKNTRLEDFDDVDKAGKFAELMRQKYYGEFKGEN